MAKIFWKMQEIILPNFFNPINNTKIGYIMTGNAAVVNFPHPVKLSGKETAQIKMREPKVIDFRYASKKAESDFEHDLLVISQITELTMDELNSLTFSEYQPIKRAYTDFLS
jgi:hypothetical protein